MNQALNSRWGALGFGEPLRIIEFAAVLGVSAKPTLLSRIKIFGQPKRKFGQNMQQLQMCQA
jgi:hypothetical protein